MDNVYAFTDVFTKAETADIRDKLASVTFAEGKATASGVAATVKNNEQVLLDAVEGLPELFKAKVSSNRAIQRVAIARTYSGMLVSRYGVGMSYGTHTDAAFLRSGKRSDLSFTLFLSEKGDYDGGELVLETPFGEQALRLDAGSLILYPTGYVHRVNEVTRGERLVIVGWIESRIRDSRQRKILLDLADARNEYLEKVGDDATAQRLLASIENLKRMWDS